MKDIDPGKKKLPDKTIETMKAYMDKEINFKMVERKSIDKIFDWKSGATV